MAVDALAQYSRRLHELDPDMRPEQCDDRAPHDEAATEPVRRRRAHALQERQVCAFGTARFQTVSSPQQSKDLVASRIPSIVISSSGMATGGRVLHHLKTTLPDARNSVLFVGYQAAGTRGRALVNGETQVKIHGAWVQVKAHVEIIESMSAHADAGEILRWLDAFPRPPGMTYLVHGEPDAMEAMGRKIGEQLGWAHHMPEHGERVELS
jgi:metallo-beta-lactamase family protein